MLNPVVTYPCPLFFKFQRRRTQKPQESQSLLPDNNEKGELESDVEQYGLNVLADAALASFECLEVRMKTSLPSVITFLRH